MLFLKTRFGNLVLQHKTVSFKLFSNIPKITWWAYKWIRHSHYFPFQMAKHAYFQWVSNVRNIAYALHSGWKILHGLRNCRPIFPARKRAHKNYKKAVFFSALAAFQRDSPWYSKLAWSGGEEIWQTLHSHHHQSNSIFPRENSAYSLNSMDYL